MPKPKPKARVSTKNKGKAKNKKGGLLKALHHSLSEGDLGLSARQGAKHIVMMMMLRAKRLQKWLLWLKRRRLALKKRLRNLDALERLLHEEMRWTQECQRSFRLMTDPTSLKKTSSDGSQSDLDAQNDFEFIDEPFSEEKINALLTSFPHSKNPLIMGDRTSTKAERNHGHSS